jgi:hypothetical protein
MSTDAIDDDGGSLDITGTSTKLCFRNHFITGDAGGDCEGVTNAFHRAFALCAALASAARPPSLTAGLELYAVK